MNKRIRNLIILAVILFVCPALSQADIVYIKNGDKLFGTILSRSFSVQTPYGEVNIKNELLKSIDYNAESIGRWTLETINNDRFSGTLLNESIQFIEEDGRQRVLGKKQIQRLKRETREPSYPITTTIFTMKNNDRFSGRFLDAALEIQANYTADSIQPGEINRIEFAENNPADTTILLENGDLITGTLKQNQIRLAPDAVAELTVSKSSLKSIQFNAPKMVLNKFSSGGRSEEDGDEDGIPDFADICPDTPRGVRVSQDGCPLDTKVAGIGNHAARETMANNGYAIHKRSAGNLDNILFDFDRFELKPRYYSDLDEIAAILRQNPEAKIEINGHTDNVGTAAYNQRLSEKRAGTVKNYLVRKGIEKDRLFPRGFGFMMNAAPNENEVGRALNRRVEIILQN
jgi:outer membrane protein OmpA-like peptidoglycan-associated protein